MHRLTFQTACLPLDPVHAICAALPHSHSAVSLIHPSLISQILHPAVVPFQISPGPRSNIILLGRLFAGRQSKGHHIAIKLFKALR